MTKRKLASVNVGKMGRPGDYASIIECELWQIAEGRFEAIGSYATGTNQGYFRNDYSYGPWRGRGGDVESAVEEMLESVPENYREIMRQAGREAGYEAEDVISSSD